MLADPELLGNELAQSADALFDPDFWRAREQLTPVRGGRGSAWFIGGSDSWVLRHYRRGGLMARISRDHYWWNGEAAVRSFAEWRLLEWLASRGLPVPRPVAAHYQRSALTYRCDLITQRLMGTDALSHLLAKSSLPEQTWRNIAAVVAQLHQVGVDHADLNAHNILLDAQGRASVIDFDRSRLRNPGPWQQRNLQRLHRSLLKVTAGLPPQRFSPVQWSWFTAAYRSAA